MLLPRAHTARMEGVVAKPPVEIAAIIRDVRAYPNWRRGLVVQDISETTDAITYVELADEDRIAYRLAEPVRDAQFVATITDPSLPFGGAWTITLTPEGGGTRVRIQEDGEVRDPIYRLFAHFVFGYTSSMKTYLENLGATDITSGGIHPA
jgi:uncharacterized protein YndB with AHSA1/START domain